MSNYIFESCQDDNVTIHPHCNSKFCSQRIIEVDPAKTQIKKKPE